MKVGEPGGELGGHSNLLKNLTGVSRPGLNVAPYKTMNGGQGVHIHPSSVLFAFHQGSWKTLPQCVIYTDLLVTTKQYMRSITVIDEKWLPELAPRMFNVKGVPAALSSTSVASSTVSESKSTALQKRKN